jgi:hypothetical protein
MFRLALTAVFVSSALVLARWAGMAVVAVAATAAGT